MLICNEVNAFLLDFYIHNDLYLLYKNLTNIYLLMLHHRFTQHSFARTVVATLLIVLLLSACKKESVEGSEFASLDKGIFFSITFSGKTLTSYGINFKVPGISNKDYLYISGGTYTSNGQLVSDADLVIEPDYTLYQLKEGDVWAEFDLKSKPGSLTGTYSFATSGSSTYFYSDVYDNTTATSYDVDPVNSSVTITSIQDQVVSGEFRCNLISGSTRIPATGSFKLHAE